MTRTYAGVADRRAQDRCAGWKINSPPTCWLTHPRKGWVVFIAVQPQIPQHLGANLQPTRAATTITSVRQKQNDSGARELKHVQYPGRGGQAAARRCNPAARLDLRGTGPRAPDLQQVAEHVRPALPV